MVIREKIIELAWKYGDGVLPSQIKDTLESYVEEELFKGMLDTKHSPLLGFSREKCFLLNKVVTDSFWQSPFFSFIAEYFYSR